MSRNKILSSIARKTFRRQVVLRREVSRVTRFVSSRLFQNCHATLQVGDTNLLAPCAGNLYLVIPESVISKIDRDRNLS